jgi:hypothetical protein
MSSDKKITDCYHCGDNEECTDVTGSRFYYLCYSCKKAYEENERYTEYCSMSCIISGHCDESC